MTVRGRYGRLDRFFHRIAFRLGIAQRVLGDLEDSLYGDELRSIPLVEPVFITGLPRAGTSILLRLVAQTGRFASHTYRDVPFVLCPILWDRFSRRFRTEVPTRERAHGDGLPVSADTPEAFEEMIWKHFWPDHYRSDRILPWSPEDRRSEFEAFLETHMRKLIRVRRADPSDELRYVSKNNLNFARLAALPRPMVSGTFVVPFRDPLQQAASMLAQHRRFLCLHADDPFVRDYMEAIGHHEFGEALLPVDIDGWLEGAPPPDQLEFWVRYWIHAYCFILDNAQASVVLVSYDHLIDEPGSALARLAGEIDVPEESLVGVRERIRPPRFHDVDPTSLPNQVLERAAELHETLVQRARP